MPRQLSYSFLTNVVADEQFSAKRMHEEANMVVHRLPESYTASLLAIRERVRFVNHNRVTQWVSLILFPFTAHLVDPLCLCSGTSSGTIFGDGTRMW